MAEGHLKATAPSLLDFQCGFLSVRISFRTDFFHYGFPRIALLIILWARKLSSILSFHYRHIFPFIEISVTNKFYSIRIGLLILGM